MNPRHAELIAKLNAGELKMDQAKLYNETLCPMWGGAETKYGDKFVCECSQCLGVYDLTAEQMDAVAVPGDDVHDPTCPLSDDFAGLCSCGALPPKTWTCAATYDPGSGCQTNEMGSGALSGTNSNDLVIAGYCKRMDAALEVVKLSLKLAGQHGVSEGSELEQTVKAACEFLRKEWKGE